MAKDHRGFLLHRGHWRRGDRTTQHGRAGHLPRVAQPGGVQGGLGALLDGGQLGFGVATKQFAVPLPHDERHLYRALPMGTIQHVGE